MRRLCKKHPNYKGLREPRVACAGCWWIWFIDQARLLTGYKATR